MKVMPATCPVSVADPERVIPATVKAAECISLKFVHDAPFHFRRDPLAGTETHHGARVFPLKRNHINEPTGGFRMAAKNDRSGRTDFAGLFPASNIFDRIGTVSDISDNTDTIALSVL